ncbi:MAG: sulfite exporter TauE/SafE family protein, partial [Thermodesulfovibrio aggregans]
GSIAGAVLGNYLMRKKLSAPQVKKVIGVVLYIIAAKMIWDLIK